MEELLTGNVKYPDGFSFRWRFNSVTRSNFFNHSAPVGLQVETLPSFCFGTDVRFTPTRAADWTGRLCEIAGYKSPGSLVNHSLSYIGRRR